MTETKAVQKRKRPDLQPVLEDGDNSRYLSHMIELKESSKIDLNNADQVKARIEWYFQKCIENDMKPGIESLALALHTNRKTLYRWANDYSRRDSKHSDVIKDAYQVISSMMEAYMQNGKINPVAGIFLMANNMGYQQKVTHSVEPPQQSPLEGKSIDEIRARYAADIYDLEPAEPANATDNEEDEF